MVLCTPRFHLSVAVGYRALRPVRESLSLPESTAPPGPGSVASTPALTLPRAPATVTAAWPPATGDANVYVGATKRKSARAFRPAVSRPPRTKVLSPAADAGPW